MKKNKPVDQVNKMTSAEIREKLCSPPVLGENDQYRIKFAMTPEEIEAAFRLRYQVFKVEQGKNIQDSGNRESTRMNSTNTVFTSWWRKKRLGKLSGLTGCIRDRLR